MFDYELAKTYFEMIDSSKQEDLKKSLYKSAVRYAHIRAEWKFKSLEEKRDEDSDRTIAHNAFIADCDILGREMSKAGEDITWRVELWEDRQLIGDFACYIHLFLGLKAR